MAFLSQFMKALLNEHWIDSPSGAIPTDSRGFRYGAGLFETIRFEKEKAPLWSGHMDRLLQSIRQLGWQLPALFTTDRLFQDVLRLIQKNKIPSSARVRITVSNGHGGLFDGDGKLSWLIEAWPLDPARKEFNSNGWVIGLYEDARKSSDALSELKSTSALIYAQAAQYAKQQKWNDALVLNNDRCIADSCIANLFLVKDDKLITTDRGQGAVNGVMQTWLLERVADTMEVQRRPILPEDLLQADEVFLTNALFGIRWVGAYQDKRYGQSMAARLYQRYIRTIFP